MALREGQETHDNGKTQNLRGFGSRQLQLKQLARELGIEKNITTYTARHSHATALIHNGASLEFVMDQFKHGSMKTTMNYVDSIDDTKRKDLAKLL